MRRLRFGSTNPFETDKRIPHRRIARAMAPRRTDDLLHTLESRERAGCSSTVVASKQGKKRRRVAGDAKKLPDADAGRTLDSWVEVESLKRCEANYCTLVPPPRSTIAAAFSHDGTYLASTHGDHTVKVICCRTGECIRTLTGHRRTPWVVRFHPQKSHILASGSLDHEVRLWNTETNECTNVWDFGRPIASLAFHAAGNIIAVASGHRLYMWDYQAGMKENPKKPVVVLRTRRSLRAVHFHPLGFDMLLTAEVNDPEAAQENPPSQASTFPRPHLDTENAWNAAYAAATAAAVAVAGGESEQSSANVPLQLRELVPEAGQALATGRPLQGQLATAAEIQEHIARYISEVPVPMETGNASRGIMEEGYFAGGGDVVGAIGAAAAAAATARWRGPEGSTGEGPAANLNIVREFSMGVAPFLPVAGWDLPRDILEQIEQHAQSSTGRGAPAAATAAAAAAAATAAAAAAIVGQEQPCTVKLRLWKFDAKDPYSALEAGTEKSLRLVIPHAVLCSEMGAHFSPCGRYLASCVVCAPPGDYLWNEGTGQGASRPLVYELRVYSLLDRNFGEVLASRVVRAAHCLTSIQFSPTSEHLLLAYGRRHISLLRSLVADGGRITPVHTILEVYSVQDMSLIRVLPSAEDEVNVACFHPHAGGGLVYGTKEGRLRILQPDGRSSFS